MTENLTIHRSQDMPHRPARRSYIVDPQLNEVPVGTTGQICVRVSKAGSSYRNQPALTAERFVPDPFSQVPGGRLHVTDGEARRGANGAWDFTGHGGRQVKIRGRRIALGNETHLQDTYQTPLAA